MWLIQWLLRCVPGLSTVLLLFLIEYSLQLTQTAYSWLRYQERLESPNQTPVGQLLFCAYSIFLHTLALLFPIRLIWAARQATKAIWTEHLQRRARTKSREHEHGKIVKDQGCRSVIILPAYKESVDTLEETLDVLAQHADAKVSYDVFLALEERDPGALHAAEHLMLQYTGSFFDFQYTLHPSDIPGESAGKSSNVSWAAKEMERKYKDCRRPNKVIVTVMDSDAHLLNQHFQILLQRTHHLRHDDDYVLWVPTVVFDRNSQAVPRLVRMADIVWCGAGLSCFKASQSSSHVSIPTAVYTLSLPLVRLVNGWDADAGAIGEDMHMMLKCYFATNGRLRIESLSSPVSLCNVSTSTNGIRGWADNHSARYRQAVRHMWGCLDTGYALRQCFAVGGTVGAYKQTSVLTLRTAVVFMRLFEAHFLPIHLFLMIVASAIYTGLPLEPVWYLKHTLDLTAILRTMGFALMTIYFVLVYEGYHATCLAVREYESRQVGLYHNSDFAHRSRWTVSSLLDYLAFPVAGFIYGSFPLLQAMISHFWTDNLTYLVSMKPTRMTVSRKDGFQVGKGGMVEEDAVARSGNDQ